MWNIQSQTVPLTMRQILNAVAAMNETPDKYKKKATDKILKDVRQRGVDFSLTKENEALLRTEGATDEIIEAIRQKMLPVSTTTPNPNNSIDQTPLSSDSPKTFQNSFGMEFVFIPNGSFEMGSIDGHPDEKPVHRVTISNSFYMGKYEVTQEEYMKATGTKPSDSKHCPRCPVEMVSWEDAQELIKKLNSLNEGTYRLPTEAEWEYAARAGTTTKWSFGDDESALIIYAWYSVNSDKTQIVGTRQPNNFGLYDMHGNVWEACQDWYGENYYTKNPVTDPMGPSQGTERVYRSGSFFFNYGIARSADRHTYAPTLRSKNIGLRLVRQ